MLASPPFFAPEGLKAARTAVYYAQPGREAVLLRSSTTKINKINKTY
jgi:hypothetical protein